MIPTPPPTALPWTRATMIFGHRIIAMMSRAKPMKNFFPPAASRTACSSENEAPAQNAPVPSLHITITRVSGSIPAISTDPASWANRLEGSELLFGCEKEMVVTPLAVFDAACPVSVISSTIDEPGWRGTGIATEVYTLQAVAANFHHDAQVRLAPLEMRRKRGKRWRKRSKHLSMNPR